MNTQSVPPAGGLSVDAARAQAVLSQVARNRESIAALHAENQALVMSVPGLALPDLLTREERHLLADYDFRVDTMPMDVLAPAMLRIRDKGDGFPARISHPEAQLVFGFRAIAHGAYGEMFVKTSEKRRVEIAVTIRGR